MRPFGEMIDANDIFNELRVINALGSHQNVVHVLACGPLPCSDYYYIDMELCSHDLRKYIAEKGSVVDDCLGASNTHDILHNFIRILKVLADIANGLKYIHSLHEVHRDLKPMNGTSFPKLANWQVLCSLQNVWKLADFGVTTTGFSQRT